MLRRNVLQFSQCVGLSKPSKLLFATPPPYNPDTVNQTVDYGGAKWRGQPGGNWEQISGGDSSGGNVDVIGNAQKLLEFQKQANAPVAAAVGSQIAPTQDKYSQLVASIKGNQTLDTNRQTLTTSNTLGGRGLTSNSGVYQQELTNALTPIDLQYAGLLANANAGSIQDINNLILQQAQLLAGNPESAIPYGLQYGGLQQQAAQTAAQLQAAQIEANRPIAATAGGFIYNPSNGAISIAPNYSTLSVGQRPTLPQIFGKY